MGYGGYSTLWRSQSHILKELRKDNVVGKREGVKIALSSTLQEFLTRTPCNKRQTNRRKTNTSSITYVATVHMGNDSEMSYLQRGMKRSLCCLPKPSPFQYLPVERASLSRFLGGLFFHIRGSGGKERPGELRRDNWKQKSS